MIDQAKVDKLVEQASQNVAAKLKVTAARFADLTPKERTAYLKMHPASKFHNNVDPHNDQQRNHNSSIHHHLKNTIQHGEKMVQHAKHAYMAAKSGDMEGAAKHRLAAINSHYDFNQHWAKAQNKHDISDKLNYKLSGDNHKKFAQVHKLSDAAAGYYKRSSKLSRKA